MLKFQFILENMGSESGFAFKITTLKIYTYEVHTFTKY